MKEISIVCDASGRAIVTTTDLHVESENLASKIILDFSETETLEENEISTITKWCDIILPDGTSLRYGGDVDAELEIEMTNEVTVSGELIVTPFEMDGARKIKFVPNQRISIKKSPDAGDEEAPTRDDYIFELAQRVDVIDGGDF